MNGRRRSVQALDLVDDPRLIAEYCQHHQRIWPEIAQHLRQPGVLEMEIYLLGNRLVMVMETDEQFDADRFARLSADNPRVQAWEALMWRYQQPTPWTTAGEKWQPMTPVFSLAEQP